MIVRLASNLELKNETCDWEGMRIVYQMLLTPSKIDHANAVTPIAPAIPSCLTEITCAVQRNTHSASRKRPMCDLEGTTIGHRMLLTS